MMVGIGMVFGLILMVLFWGGLILGAIWLVRMLFSGNHPSTNSISGKAQTVQQILDQRYARGEINREQYDRMKGDIL